MNNSHAHPGFSTLPAPGRLPEQAAALGRHLQTCHDAQAWQAPAWMWLERTHALLAPRFFTTVLIAALMLAACTAWV